MISVKVTKQRYEANYIKSVDSESRPAHERGSDPKCDKVKSV